MSAIRKSVAMHQMQGTYQPCRHEQRAKKTQENAGVFAKCPSELSDEAKQVWRRIIKSLPGVSELDAPLLAQVCSMYSRFLSEPQFFTSAEHNQLRLLIKELRHIETPPEEESLDELGLMADRNRKKRYGPDSESLKELKAKHPCIQS